MAMLPFVCWTIFRDGEYVRVLLSSVSVLSVLKSFRLGDGVDGCGEPGTVSLALLAALTCDGFTMFGTTL